MYQKYCPHAVCFEVLLHTSVSIMFLPPTCLGLASCFKSPHDVSQHRVATWVLKKAVGSETGSSVNRILCFPQSCQSIASGVPTLASGCLNGTHSQGATFSTCECKHLACLKQVLVHHCDGKCREGVTLLTWVDALTLLPPHS